MSQALFFLNHPFVRTQASGAATRVLAERKKPTDPEAGVRRAYLLALGHFPSREEIALVQKVLAAAREPQEAWADIFQALFASVDFRYLN